MKFFDFVKREKYEEDLKKLREELECWCEDCAIKSDVSFFL
jgi:hypothetical protein